MNLTIILTRGNPGDAHFVRAALTKPTTLPELQSALAALGLELQERFTRLSTGPAPAESPQRKA
jgi:hypothetical protein